MQAFVSSDGSRRMETVLKNIERTEPDAALLQIPSDYTIEERAIDSSEPPELPRRKNITKPNSLQRARPEGMAIQVD